MRKIHPIPLELLIHDIVYMSVGESDGWNDSYVEPIPILRVRIDSIQRKERSSNSTGQTSELTLLLDRSNSSQFIELKVGSKIVYKTEEYEIVEVSPFYDFDTTPHHYEIGLI